MSRIDEPLHKCHRLNSVGFEVQDAQYVHFHGTQLGDREGVVREITQFLHFCWVVFVELEKIGIFSKCTFDRGSVLPLLQLESK